MLYRFASNETKVNEYEGLLRHQPSDQSQTERQRDLSGVAADALTDAIAVWLRQQGFTVAGAPRGTTAEAIDLIIDGQIVNIDEGSPLRRLLIGFGSGASSLTTRVQIFATGGRQKVLEFTTRADSGTLPGAAATVPVGAAVPLGLSLGLSAGSVVAAGVNGNSSDVGRMAAASAEQVIRYLSEFFAKQGWISGNQIKRANIVY
jgi:Domain of unknown function (DUF4410)